MYGSDGDFGMLPMDVSNFIPKSLAVITAFFTSDAFPVNGSITSFDLLVL